MARATQVPQSKRPLNRGKTTVLAKFALEEKEGRCRKPPTHARQLPNRDIRVNPPWRFRDFENLWQEFRLKDSRSFRPNEGVKLWKGVGLLALPTRWCRSTPWGCLNQNNVTL